MKQVLNSLSTELLSKNWEDCRLDELNSLCGEHPYTAAFQLLYALKLKEEHPAKYGQQWQKTLLYFDNPLLVNYWFNQMPTGQTEEGPVVGEKTHSEPPVTVTTEVEENTSPTIDNQPVIEEPFQEQPQETTDNPAVSADNTDAREAAAPAPDGAGETEVPLPRLKIEPVDPQKAEMVFTPYYTVDYFASQGIRLGEGESADRFGKQLKSFTEWLKQMRRLPEAEVTAQFARNEEKKVENMASNSVSGENAVTAAMAEVWAKQNNPEKAIAIYQKLSLQNPAKSAFFAAKIEHLKKLL